jgi:hypothetical protein
MAEGTIVREEALSSRTGQGRLRAPHARRATILNLYTEPQFPRCGVARRFMLITFAVVW